jgi:hypothetical protein
MAGGCFHDVLAIFVSHDNSFTVQLLPNHFEHMVSGFICIVLRFKFFGRQRAKPLNDKLKGTSD